MLAFRGAVAQIMVLLLFCFFLSADGEWSAWHFVTPCRSLSGKTCEKGWRHVERKCDNPAREHGRKPCKGLSVKAVMCWDPRGCPDGLQAPADFETQSMKNKAVLVSWRQLPYGVAPVSFQIYYKLASAEDSSAKSLTVIAEPGHGPGDGWHYDIKVDLSELSGSVELWIASVHKSEASGVEQKEMTERQNLVVGEVDGSWGAWKYWSDCSVTCSTGVQTRVRHCDSPTRSAKGRPCPGKGREKQLCDRGFC